LKVRALTGSFVLIRPTDRQTRIFSVLGYLDWRLWAAAVALCEPGDTIVEAGANVGMETVGFSDIVGGDGKVVAFEPVPSSLDALRDSLLIARHRNVEMLPFALGDAELMARLEVPPGSPDRARVVRDDDTGIERVSRPRAGPSTPLLT
jgi:hypothetical protein